MATGVINQASMTELDAVNSCLNNAEIPSVSSLDAATLEKDYVAEAVKILNEVSRQIQSVGLQCNTEYNITFTPDPLTKFINVPSDSLKVDASNRYRKVLARGDKLRDLDNNTYEFEAPLDCDVTYMLPFNELPQSVRNYIAVSGARKYHEKRIGANFPSSVSRDDEQRAYSAMSSSESDNENANILDNSTILNRNNNNYIYWR